MSFFKRLFSRKKEDEKEEQKKRSGLDPKKRPTTVHKKGMDKVKPAYIDDIKVVGEIKAGKAITVQVTGMFNDLGYSMDDKIVEVIDNQIIITIMARKKAGTLSGMATKPFQTEVKIEGLKKGKYIVKPTKGKAKEIEIEVK